MLSRVTELSAADHTESVLVARSKRPRDSPRPPSKVAAAGMDGAWAATGRDHSAAGCKHIFA